MYAALSQLLYLLDLKEQRGRGFKFILWTEAKGRNYKDFFSKGGGSFCREVDPSGILSELPTYFSLL